MMRAFDRSLLVLTLLIAGIAVTLRPRLVQTGCDSPAHLLLSETLFSLKAPSGDESVRKEIADHLQTQGLKEADFSRALGPLCMHYRNERLNAQYPPLVSGVLSVAPFSSRAQFYGLFCFLLFLAIAHAIMGEWLHPLSVFAVAPLVLPVFFPDLRAIQGMVPAFALCALLVLESLRDDASSFRIGGLAALLLLTRYDSVFPLLAIGAFILLRRPYFPFVLKALTSFLALGVLPLFYYQRESMGVAYQPVTPSYDLEWVRNMSEFIHAASGSLSLSQIDLLAMFMLGAFTFHATRAVEKKFHRYWMIASAIGLAIVLMKRVQTGYYLWAWSAGMFALFMVQMSRLDFSAGRKLIFHRSLTGIVLVFSLIGAVKGVRHSIEQAELTAEWKNAVLTRFPRDERAIVEAGQWSATLDAFRQSMKAGPNALVIDGTHTSAEAGNAIRSYASGKGIIQYRFQAQPNGSGAEFVRTDRR